MDVYLKGVIPVIVVPDKGLTITKNKYLMRQDMTMMNLMMAIRRHNKGCFSEKSGMFLFCNNVLLRPDMTIQKAFKEFAKINELGNAVLMVNCCIENTFG